MTSEFGATAWGRAWLKMIEPVLITGPPDRALPRARTLARNAIEDLNIEANHVTARITDRGHEHTITLDIPIWNRIEHREITRAIGQSAPSHSGDLPDRLVTGLASAGVPIAPSFGDITATSDTGDAPRLYVLATCYALIQKIDEEPDLAVRLRTPGEPATETRRPALAGLLPITAIDPKTFYTRSKG